MTGIDCNGTYSHDRRGVQIPRGGSESSEECRAARNHQNRVRLGRSICRRRARIGRLGLRSRRRLCFTRRASILAVADRAGIMANIALVDDDKNILASVTLLLEQEGYHVRAFADGA